MQVELRGSDRELTNGHIYEISGFDMHVVVKYQQSSSETGTCSCPPSVSLLPRKRGIGDDIVKLPVIYFTVKLPVNYR